MPKISMTDFFASLDAPLNNHVWSWGALTQSKNEVILRVRRDERRKIDGKTQFRLTLHALFDKNQGQISAGYPERLEHLQIARKKGRAFLVYCRASDPTAQPRTIAGYTDHVLGVCERIVMDDEGDFWGEETRTIRVEDFLTLMRSR